MAVPVGAGAVLEARTSKVSAVGEPTTTRLAFEERLTVGITLMIVKVSGVVLEDALKLASPE